MNDTSATSGTAATQAQSARFEQITPSEGNVYAARMESGGSAFIVSTDGTTVALDAPWAGKPVFMTSAEAAAIGRELLQAAAAEMSADRLEDAIRRIEGTAAYMRRLIAEGGAQ